MRFDLSPLKIFTGALAATSAAFAASSLGLYGTVLGAAVMSVVATVATTVYDHAASRTAERVRPRTGNQAVATSTDPADPADTSDEAGAATEPTDVEATTAGPDGEVARPGGVPRPRWQMIAAGSTLAFVLGLGALTAAEFTLDQPVSELGASGGNGTTVTRLLGAESPSGSGSGTDGGTGAGRETQPGTDGGDPGQEGSDPSTEGSGTTGQDPADSGGSAGSGDQTGSGGSRGEETGEVPSTEETPAPAPEVTPAPQPTTPQETVPAPDVG
ncbi:MAG: hypothetical protein ACRDYU_10765 [Actinomycetes bacterium]